MKLVSFDIGLRNLSYCVLDGTNRSNVSILNWEVIDVMAEGAGLDAPKCFKCRKPANWTNTKEYACTLHKGKNSETKTALNKLSIQELRTRAGVFDKPKKELVNIIYESQVTWKRCIKSTKAMSVTDFAPYIANSLQERIDIWKDADCVVLEQQPDRRMLCVQSMCHMWFVCHGFRCTGISAKHKLSNIVTIDDSIHTYRGRKKTGIIHATALCPGDWKHFLLKHKKADDLADSFLQGLYFIEHEK